MSSEIVLPFFDGRTVPLSEVGRSFFARPGSLAKRQSITARCPGGRSNAEPIAIRPLALDALTAIAGLGKAGRGLCRQIEGLAGASSKSLEVSPVS